MVAELSSVAIVANELGTALERARLFEKYRVKAAYDDLTSLHNKGSINELLAGGFQARFIGEGGSFGCDG